MHFVQNYFHLVVVMLSFGFVDRKSKILYKYTCYICLLFDLLQVEKKLKPSFLASSLYGSVISSFLWNYPRQWNTILEIHTPRSLRAWQWDCSRSPRVPRRSLSSCLFFQTFPYVHRTEINPWPPGKPCSGQTLEIPTQFNDFFFLGCILSSTPTSLFKFEPGWDGVMVSTCLVNYY